MASVLTRTNFVKYVFRIPDWYLMSEKVEEIHPGSQQSKGCDHVSVPGLHGNLRWTLLLFLCRIRRGRSKFMRSVRKVLTLEEIFQVIKQLKSGKSSRLVSEQFGVGENASPTDTEEKSGVACKIWEQCKPWQQKTQTERCYGERRHKRPDMAVVPGCHST